MDFASIMSKEYADKLQADGKMEQLNQQPLGTGPFEFVAYQQDAVIRYRAHEEYWEGKQPIDDLVFAITTDAAVRMQKLQAGECHVMPYPNAADVRRSKQDANLQVMEEEGLNVAYLAFNTTQAPFDKPEVRQALNMAINKQAIVDAVFQGAATPAKNPIPPTMWSYNDAVEDYAYDPEAAKKKLEEAGVTGLSMKVWAMPVARPYMLNARRAAELIQEDFAKVGVTAEIVSYEWAEYLERSKAKDRDGAVILGWTGDNGDPDNFMHTLLGCAAVGGNNRAQWCNEEFDKLVNDAKKVSDQAERTKLYEAGAGRLQARGALGHGRPLAGRHADEQEGVRLRHEPARPSRLCRRRHRRVSDASAEKERPARRGARLTFGRPARLGRRPMRGPQCCGSFSGDLPSWSRPSSGSPSSPSRSFACCPATR